MPNPTYVYHYTDTAALRAIAREGVIRAHPTTLYRDLARTAVARITEPIVWLSSNPVMEMTTMVKLTMGTRSPIGLLARIALPYGYAGDVGLGEYTEARGIPHSDWEWNIRTALMVGSHYTTWRLVAADIPRGDWGPVSWLAAITDHGFAWEPGTLP